MRALALCLNALIASGETDLFLIDEVAYGRTPSGRAPALTGLGATTAGEALSELTAPLTAQADAEDLDVVSTDTGVCFRVSAMPASRKAVLRRVPVTPPSA